MNHVAWCNVIGDQLQMVGCNIHDPLTVQKMQEGLKKFTIVSWNVNYSPLTVGEYEAFSFEHRSAHVVGTIKLLQAKKGNTLFLLQEVMPSYLPILNVVFPKSHYNVWTKQVHPCGRMVYTAVPIEYVSEQCVSGDAIPPPGEGLRECWDVIRVFIHGNDNFWLINLHAPMEAKYRIPICNYVATHTKSYYYCIIAGDLNSFPDDGGVEQIASMETNNTYKDANSVMLRGNLESEQFAPTLPYVRVLQTFDPYPYDKVPMDSPKYFPYHLDHILISSSFRSHETALCFDGERGASDHFPISLALEM